MHFDHLVGEVHQPELRHASGRIQRGLQPAVLHHRRLGHFDNQQRAIGVGPCVVARGYDGNVGLGFGVVGGDERALDAYLDDFVGKATNEVPCQTRDDRGVDGSLRAHFNQGSCQQFDTRVRE